MKFGAIFMNDPPVSRFVELVRLAEHHGFDYAWTYDSPVLFPDAYPYLTAAALETSHIHLGHCVTNPGIRDPTVTASSYVAMQEISGGRMALGIGRGDSAVRVLGRPPVKVKEYEQTLDLMRALMRGESRTWAGAELELKWAAGQPPVPLYAAGYGPKALAVAGRVADGVIVALGDPELFTWMSGHARQAAAEVGRDAAALEFIVCAPAFLSDDLAHARDQVRWFPPMVANHVAEMVKHHDPSTLPEGLTRLVRQRAAAELDDDDYSRHSRLDDPHAQYIDDDTCERFCILGTPEDHIARISQLEEAGASICNLYIMAGDQEAILAAYGEHVIPAFRHAAAR